jgi:hypothetical protein
MIEPFEDTQNIGEYSPFDIIDIKKKVNELIFEHNKRESVADIMSKLRNIES